MDRLKYIPILLLLAFGIKYLIVGIDANGVACMAALGMAAFCLEKFLENNKILELKKSIAEQEERMKKQAEEVEQIKSFVSSIRLNGLRNGLNRTAQQ